MKLKAALVFLTVLSSQHALHQNWQFGDCLKPLHILQNEQGLFRWWTLFSGICIHKQNVNYDLVELITRHSSEGCRNISLQANHESNQ